MLNISLCFNRKDFEYDVYSLIKAFYPGCEITSWYEEDGAPDGEFAYYDKILYAADQICFSIENEKHEELSAACEAVEYEKDRHETKNVLKRMVYRTLSKVSGKELPWGDLTGIRPTKIPMKMLEEGKTNVEIAKYMRETYYTSPEKTALAITIANREKDILKTIDYEHGYSLYIGIPFCPSICLYCSFGSHVLSRWAHMVDPYLDALIKELTFISERMKDYTLDTIYIGGGTPTTLAPDQLKALLDRLHTAFDLAPGTEFTVEAGRPDTVTEEKLAVLVSHGVNRVSVNPQTMSDAVLEEIGRHHTAAQVREAVAMVKKFPQLAFNMDLIAGLPGDTPESFSDTVREVIALGAENITVHTLALKKGSRFLTEGTALPDGKAVGEMLGDAREKLEAAGYAPYYLYRQKFMSDSFENVGWTKPGYENLYNICIMEELCGILAVGAGGSTKLTAPGGVVKRLMAPKYPREYMDRIAHTCAEKDEIVRFYNSEPKGTN